MLLIVCRIKVVKMATFCHYDNEEKYTDISASQVCSPDEDCTKRDRYFAGRIGRSMRAASDVHRFSGAGGAEYLSG